MRRRCRRQEVHVMSENQPEPTSHRGALIIGVIVFAALALVIVINVL